MFKNFMTKTLIFGDKVLTQNFTIQAIRAIREKENVISFG